MGTLTTNRSYRIPLEGDTVDPVRDLQNLGNDIDTDIADIFAAAGTYLPVLTASTTNPTGQTLAGFFSQTGKVIRGRTLVTFAAGVGSGTYFLTSPVATVEAAGESAGSALFFDTSSTLRYPLAVFWVGTTTVSFSVPAGGRLTNTVPVTVGAGDQISVKWDYESA